MRLATITNWAYGVTVALTLASGTTMLLAAQAEEQERAAVTARHRLEQATSTLDRDAAALSGLARQYAVTGNPADLIAYRRELALLRSVEARTRRLRDAGASAGELRALHESLRWADALVDEQQAALEARARGDGTAAVRILFSPEYERELDRIRANVERFQDRIDARTDAKLAAATEASRRWRTASQIVLAATGLLFLGVLSFVFRRRVLRPVVRLSDVVTRLAAQDYDAVPPQLGQIDEIGDMAQALRVFRDNGIARLRLEEERDADRARRDLLSRMTQRLQGCDTIEDLKRVMTRFMPEVAPPLAGSLYLIDADRNAVARACSWGAPTRSAEEFAPAACWALRRGATHRPAGPAIDVMCGHIAADEAAPDSICMPLAAQHGTIGLLYLERHGDGEVPEEYLVMLAENVGLAIDNLQLRDRLRGLALADPLTQLGNRRRLDEVLAIQAERAQELGAPISCAMIDVDHFKRFNDEHGHDAGDAVLRALGATLKQSVRADDLAFRYGGEEFLLLLRGLAPEDATARAEEIRRRVAALRLTHEGRDLGPVTASIGVASAPAHCGYGELVRCADMALLRAKRGGRNRVVTAQEGQAALTA
jgi:diguanylate cyclase (GGDEF)-like protein